MSWCPHCWPIIASAAGCEVHKGLRENAEIEESVVTGASVASVENEESRDQGVILDDRASKGRRVNKVHQVTALFATARRHQRLMLM